MERTDELKERIRQQPLNDRLEESRRRIGDMCSKGRCPKMTIPVQHDDDDFYINTTLADAQATIAALQARVQELEEWVQDQSTANLETMRHTDEMQSRALEAEQQLTQRTAERDTARRRVGELEAREVDVVLLRDDLEQRTAECEALQVDNRTYINERHENMKQIEQLQADLAQRTAELEAVSNFIGVKYDAESKTWVSGQAPYLSAGTTKQEACIAAVDALRLACATWETKYRDLQAELERVRGELAETKEEVTCLDEQVSALNQGCLEYERLIKALPKVEGEITVGTHFNSSYISMGRCGHLDGVTFARKEDADAYADLLKHRQGMEG